MTAHRFDRITAPQRDCLRMVMMGYNSKQIAIALDILPVTVDKRIGRAVATLGAASRFEAARLLAEHEGAYQPLVYQSPTVAPPPEPDNLAASEELAAAGGDEGVQTPWLPIRPKGSRVNTLSPWQRLTWIFTIPAALAVAVGMLGFGLSVVGKILQFIHAAFS